MAVRAVLLTLAASVVLVGCIHLERGASDTHGTFHMTDGMLMQVFVEKGDDTNWTWSATAPVAFVAWEVWSEEGTDQRRLAAAANGTADAGHYEATRDSKLRFVWSQSVENTTVDVTYFLRTEGRHQTIHF